MASAGDVFFSTVCPFLAVVIGTAMFGSPLKEVIAARAKGDLGPLNPLPWVAAYINCTGWTAYGSMKRDIFVFLANMPGMCMGLFFSLSAISLLTTRGTASDKKTVMYLEAGIVGGLLFWATLGKHLNMMK